MGRIKYKKEFMDHFSGRKYFSIKDAELFLMQGGASKDYARLMLYNLRKKGEIKRLKRGYYSFDEDLDIVGFIFEPFYYGLQEALSLQGLWGQGTNPVIITTRKVRTGMRSILGRNIIIRHIQKKMFFGYEPKRVKDRFMPVSDIEKTLIDFVYFKSALPDDVLREIIKRLDRNKLERYLKKTNKYTRDGVNRLLK
jgi:predicted transcriptional regulator of viral defense system